LTSVNGTRKNATTVFRRGADGSTWSRGTGKTGLKLKITGKCGSYYYVEPPSTFKYNDGKHPVSKARKSFLAKSAVTVKRRILIGTNDELKSYVDAEKRHILIGTTATNR
jgi:hypothetical protein